MSSIYRDRTALTALTGVEVELSASHLQKCSVQVAAGRGQSEGVGSRQWLPKIPDDLPDTNQHGRVSCMTYRDTVIV